MRRAYRRGRREARPRRWPRLALVERDAPERWSNESSRSPGGADPVHAGCAIEQFQRHRGSRSGARKRPHTGTGYLAPVGQRQPVERDEARELPREQPRSRPVSVLTGRFLVARARDARGARPAEHGHLRRRRSRQYRRLELRKRARGRRPTDHGRRLHWGLIPFGPSYAFSDYDLAREIGNVAEDRANFVMVEVRLGRMSTPSAVSSPTTQTTPSS